MPPKSQRRMNQHKILRTLAHPVWVHLGVHERACRPYDRRDAIETKKRFNKISLRLYRAVGR